MIAAKDAKSLYDASGAETTRYLLTHVEPEVIKAANSGKRSIFVDFGSYEMLFHAHRPSDLESYIMDKLKALGYAVTWEGAYGASYVPRGLADLDGNGPKYIKYGMTVQW